MRERGKKQENQKRLNYEKSGHKWFNGEQQEKIQIQIFQRQSKNVSK